MYIAEKYWNNYIGDTDDSMALVEHLEEKQKKELSFAELFADFGLDQLHGEFQKTEIPLREQISEKVCRPKRKQTSSSSPAAPMRNCRSGRRSCGRRDMPPMYCRQAGIP